MPTYKNDSGTAALFLFNQIISWFGIPREIVTEHGRHFQNQLMSELALKLGFQHEHLSLYYPQANGQVEAMNKSTIGSPSFPWTESPYHCFDPTIRYLGGPEWVWQEDIR